jgi:hypothetical protein
MNTITPNVEQGRALGAATLLTINRDGGDAVLVDENNQFHEWRMVQRGRYCLVKKPPNDRLPNRIDAYQLEDNAGSNFKLDPRNKLYSLQFDADGHPHLVILQPCGQWFGDVMLTLVGVTA